MKIGVTGATGFIGRGVARGLAAKHKDLRLIVRDARKAPAGNWGVRSTGGYFDKIGNVSALRGVDVLFMVSAAESADRVAHQKAFIEAAVKAGVKHIVYTSFIGAAPDATFTLARDHWATEEAIRCSGMAHTFLRNSFYMDFFPEAAADGVIAGPAGKGRTGAVARADVVDAVVGVLDDPDAHTEKTYELTGPETIDLAQVAAIITELANRPTSYVDQDLAEAYETRRKYNVPEWQIEAWVSTYTAIASGVMDVVTGDVRTLSGHDPMSFAEFIALDNPSKEHMLVY